MATMLFSYSPSSALRTLALCASLVTACKKPGAEAPVVAAEDVKPVKVTTVAAVGRAVPQVLLVTGALTADQRSEVTPLVNGRDLVSERLQIELAASKAAADVQRQLQQEIERKVAVGVANANATAKVGQQVELVVKVARLHDYAGEFKVELVLPKGVQGLSAEAVTIPAGANEVKLAVRVPENAQPGNRQNLTVRAVATLEGDVALTHETKVNVNVTK